MLTSQYNRHCNPFCQSPQWSLNGAFCLSSIFSCLSRLFPFLEIYVSFDIELCLYGSAKIYSSLSFSHPLHMHTQTFIVQDFLISPFCHWPALTHQSSSSLLRLLVHFNFFQIISLALTSISISLSPPSLLLLSVLPLSSYLSLPNLSLDYELHMVCLEIMAIAIHL